MKEYIFKLEMKVRDYECDLQGVVNNANYQHYMEHTRHEYLESLGENFGEIHEKGRPFRVVRKSQTRRYQTRIRTGYLPEVRWDSGCIGTSGDRDGTRRETDSWRVLRPSDSLNSVCPFSI